MKSALNKKYYIEFVGQHTAGKTVTIHEIVDNGLLSPKIAIYPQQIKRSQIHFLLSLTILVIKNLKHLWFVVSFLLRYTKWSWINYHSAWRHLLKMVLLHPYYSNHFDFDLWLKDDMLHILPRLDFKKGVEVFSALQEYFSHFSSLYSGIVYIDLPYEIMNQRFEKRFQTRDPKRRENRGPVYERAFEQNILLRQIISEQTEIPFLILDGTNNVSHNARQVVEFINTKVYEK